MAGIKATYGKRSKKTTTFSSMTDLFTSPTGRPTEPKTMHILQEDPEACFSPFERTEHELESRRSKRERQQQALQPVDSNISRSPCHPPKTKRSSITATAKDEAKVASTPAKVSRKRTVPPDQKAPQRPELHKRNDLNQKQTPEKVARTPEKALMSMAKISRSDLKKASSTSTRVSEPRPNKSDVKIAKPRRSDPYAHHTRRLLRLCSDPEGRLAPRPFSEWAASLEPQFNVLKIAEASYGEVYRLVHKEELPGFSKSDESVFKMIALKPPTIKHTPGKRKTEKDMELDERIENMSSVKSVLGEVKLLRRMSEVPGFTNFREIHVLQGVPSEPFITAWRDWNSGRPEEKQSIFADPGIEGSYDETQLWAVIEMQDAGSDLEERDMKTVGGIFGIWDIFWGVVLALGKGEEEAQFEHRDLHMGNICIRPINSNKPIAAPSSAPQLARKLNFTGLETTIIDYTLSRAQMTSPAQNPEPALSDIAYEDLEQQGWLFEADSTEEYQYEIYRYMRGAAFLDDPLADVDARAKEVEANGRTWAGFHPQTNLMWLHFLLNQMMAQIVPTKKGKPRGKGAKKKGAVKEDAQFEKLLVKKKQELEKILDKVQEVLDPESVGASGVWSAKDLILYALEEGWLDEDDVIAGDEDDLDEDEFFPGQSMAEVMEKLDLEKYQGDALVTSMVEMFRASKI